MSPLLLRPSSAEGQRLRELRPRAGGRGGRCPLRIGRVALPCRCCSEALAEGTVTTTSETFPHHVRARRAEEEGDNGVGRWIYPGRGSRQVGSKKVGEGNPGSRKREAATRLTMREDSEGKKGLGE